MLSFLKRWRDPLLVTALLLAPLSSYLSNGHRGREQNFADRLVLGLSWPVQASLTWLVQQSVSLVQGYIALRGAHDEAQVCRVELAETQAERNALREAKAENERLRRALAYAESTVDTEIVARIIGLNPSAQFLAVRIDRGASSSVRVGMPVVTPEGVLGQVVRVADTTSDVMLLTDPASRIGSVIQRTRRRATVSGSGDGRELTLDFVRREDELVEGDAVVTAGSDGVFPPGLVVGRVKSVTRPLVGMFLSSRVLPAVDLERVEEVLVIPVTRVSTFAERRQP